MKRNYSYFIIKPDGTRFLDEICHTIEHRYQSVRYYAIEDFEETIKKVYYKHFERKGENFKQSFQAYLYGIREIFGNYGIMVLLADSTGQYDELMQSVYRTKMEIREQYVNNNIGIVTNYGDWERNYIKMMSEDGKEQTPRIMNTLGTHRISDLNIIHCPDPNKEDTLKELNILLQSGVINDKNMITEQMMQQMRRYQTAVFQKDMRIKGYEGAIQPDISGFIENEIQLPTEEENLR